MTATIVDLAVRGYLTISEVPGQKDWLFTQKNVDTSTLLPYEKTILAGLFDGRSEVNLLALKFTFQPTLRQAEDEVIADAMSRKFFTGRPDVRRIGWAVAGIFGIAIASTLTFQLGKTFGWGLVGLAVVVVSMVALAGSRFMAQRTAAGRDVMQHALGFRLYMTTGEKYRQQFAANAQIFTWLLPYAIVFGCVNLWAKAFEGIDIRSSTNNWYFASQPFQAGLLAGSLESMNSNISSAIALTPASTGGSSGFSDSGGFSGGGGGGGGGGSW